MFKELGFKNTIKSKTIGFLTLLLILLQCLFLLPPDLQYLDTIRYLVLGLFLVLLLYFLLDHTVEKKVIKNTKEMSNIIGHLDKENKRLYKIQSSDLTQFGKWKNETMSNKGSVSTETQTK